MSHRSAIQRAIEKFDGSPTKLAAAIGGDVKRQHIEHWLKSGRVPPEHCQTVSELTGEPLWKLRPDDWHRIWPMVVGTKGAPKVPADTSSKGVSQDHAKAAKHLSRDKGDDRRFLASRGDKPSNRKGR